MVETKVYQNLYSLQKRLFETSRINIGSLQTKSIDLALLPNFECFKK